MIELMLQNQLAQDLFHKDITPVAQKQYSIVDDGQIHMARMAIYATHSTNGVAAVHTEILKNDALREMLFTYAIAADDRLARRCIDDFHRSLCADGLVNGCWPSVKNNVIPGFSLYYIMMIHDHMMYFGDRALVRRYLPTVDAILEFFERTRDDRGLVGKTGGIVTQRSWSFIDWVPEWAYGVPNAYQSGPLTMESLLYAATLDMAAHLAEYAGRPEQGEEYRARAQAVKQAVNTHCLGENGMYQDGPGVEEYSQHCQVWAVLSEAAPAETRRGLMERMLADKALPKCSVSMAFYLFRAMEKAGLYAQTLPLWEPWRQMLRDNLTTCVENDTGARSDCHAWGSIILYELPAVVLGVRPAKPGCEVIEVKPNTAWLDSAQGTVITPRGPIHVAWEKTPNGLKLDVDAPEGVEVLLT